ncbi:hypothetical protein ACIQXF_11820 [Lysinibacillus sp. NPDC097231]|uniref:hypothetical protein n=1 Tax=Lysinibacillus sp. NPDC097231 TaxID=3364142 RepID=UPI00382FCE63
MQQQLLRIALVQVHHLLFIPTLNSWSDYGYWDLEIQALFLIQPLLQQLNWGICTSCGMSYSTTNVGEE